MSWSITRVPAGGVNAAPSITQLDEMERPRVLEAMRKLRLLPFERSCVPMRLS